MYNRDGCSGACVSNPEKVAAVPLHLLFITAYSYPIFYAFILRLFSLHAIFEQHADWNALCCFGKAVQNRGGKHRTMVSFNSVTKYGHMFFISLMVSDINVTEVGGNIGLMGEPLLCVACHLPHRLIGQVWELRIIVDVILDMDWETSAKPSNISQLE